MNVKWLRRLHVAAEPAYSREETSKYTDLLPDGTAREFSFYMEAKSIITRPSGTQRLSAPGFHEITGIAWSGHGKIKRVEVSVDDGKSWQDAQLQEPVLTRALTRFRLPWQWDGKPAVIQSRAIDEQAMCSRRSLSCSRCAARIIFTTTTRSGPGVSPPTER